MLLLYATGAITDILTRCMSYVFLNLDKSSHTFFRAVQSQLLCVLRWCHCLRNDQRIKHTF